MIHPTVEEIRALSPAGYIEKNNGICVRVRIQDRQLTFTCPFCYKSYNRDGNPRANSKHATHYHGYNGKNDFYQGERKPHCLHHSKGRFFHLYYVPDDETLH